MVNNINDLNQEDVKLADYIFSILKFQPAIVMSWGFQRPMVIKLGLKFTVNGFRHKGNVEIRYNEGSDLFDIYLINEDETQNELIEGIYFDQLVEVVDEHVEMVENYTEQVNEFYNIQTIIE